LAQARIDTITTKTRKPLLTPFLNGFFYGDSGVGKTTLLGTAADHPETGPILLVDCEGGDVTLRKRQEGVEVIRVNTIKEIDEIHEALFYAKPDELKWKSVGLDSISEIQDVDMRYIMKIAHRDNANQDEEVPSPREYGKSRLHMRELVRAFRDLHMHVWITGLAWDKQEEGRPTRTIPNLTGKVAAEIPGFLGIVGHYRKERDGSRILQLSGTPKIPFCKTRYPELGEFIINPTIPNIYDTIFNPQGANGNVTSAS
jgi:phage nucleotide-binding protein